MGTGHLTQAVRVSGAHHTLPDGRPLFTGLDLDVAPGESLVLLGPSGCGKSTLLRMIAGLEALGAGEIDLSGVSGGAADGSSARGGRRSRADLAMVFQQPLLYPWLTVRENVALGSRFAATRGRVDAEHLDDLLEQFGIAGLADAAVGSLSGGQAQRVAVIRAAATRPRLLLLDEPFSALDPLTRAESQRWLVSVTDELDLTSVLVTHDVDEALVVGSRIALIGDGRIRDTWRNPFRGDGTRGGDESAVDFRAEILASYTSSAVPA